MISVEHASKRYLTRQGWWIVLYDISLKMEKGKKIGIFSHNGVGKSTLIRLISGAESPTTGEIKRTMSTSWPLAFFGAFQGSLTGMGNLCSICRVYNVDIDYVKNFTEELSELGQYLCESVKRCSSGMKARLAFTSSSAVELDCYLTDEVTAVGDSRFADKCKHELSEKRKDRSIILVLHSHSAMKQYCDNAMVLEKGHMCQFEDIDKAYEYYNSLP